MPPVLATPIVDTDVGPLSRLMPHERQYVRGLKRKERNSVVKILEADAKRPCTTTPLRIQVLQSPLPQTLQMQIFDTLRGCPGEKYITWVQKLLAIPLQRMHKPVYTATSLTEAIRAAEQTMDAVVTGHGEVKTEVLKLVCQELAGGTCASAYAIGLEGPPGTGKTHFVRNAMATALDRPMVSIQLGGAADVSYLLGQMYTYEGSKEGRLVAGLIESGCCNPIFYFDEVDKISETERGREISAILIHLVDPTSNTHIRDRYFHGVDLDFSKCTFVFSYNDASRVSPVLLDRIKRIRIDPPTREQRCTILRDHIIPRVSARLNAKIALNNECMEWLVERSDRSGGGMRGLEKDVDHILSYVQLMRAKGVLSGEEVPLRVAKEVQVHSEAASASPPALMYA